MAKYSFELNLPESLSDITLEQYQRYMKVVESNEDDENASDFLNLKALDIFCGVDLSKSYDVPIKHFMFALEKLESCFSEKTPLIQRFTLKDGSGKEGQLGFIPNLEEMSFGEYTDLDKYITDWSNMHRAMAVMYRPIRIGYKDKYELHKYKGTDEWADVMKEMPLSIVFGAVVFFYRLGMKLSENMTLSSLDQQTQLRLTKETLLKGGVGFRHLLHSLRETTLASMRQQRFHSVKP